MIYKAKNDQLRYIGLNRSRINSPRFKTTDYEMGSKVTETQDVKKINEQIPIAQDIYAENIPPTNPLPKSGSHNHIFNRAFIINTLISRGYYYPYLGNYGYKIALEETYYTDTVGLNNVRFVNNIGEKN
jgi:hypothetical protein